MMLNELLSLPIKSLFSLNKINYKHLSPSWAILTLQTASQVGFLLIVVQAH